MYILMLTFIRLQKLKDEQLYRSEAGAQNDG